MPTYMYKCAECGHRFEAVQGFHDDPLDTCPECAGAARRVIGNVGVTFKGSGFYRTDSRGDKKSGAGKPAESKPAADSTPAKPAESKPAESKPAAKKESSKPA